MDSNSMAQLIEENLSAKSLDFASLPGGELHHGNVDWFTSGIDRAGYNGITCACFENSELDRQVKDALEPFRSKNIPLSWWVGPLSRPGSLGRVLQSHGFTHNRDMIGMAAELKQLAPFRPPKVAYEFVPVINREGFEAWFPLFAATFGIPADDAELVLEAFSQLSFSAGSNWRHYMICMDGQVAATSSLHLGAGVAGLYNIAVRPEYRRHGLGTAITLLTYEEAGKSGYGIGTLQTTYPNALRLYHRMGFEVYCKIGIYQRHWQG